MKFAVLMHRWGHAEDHIYLLGCWDSVEEAELRASDAVTERGGKYDAVVWNVQEDGYRGKAVCTYRGLGFGDRVAGVHLAS